MSIVIVAPPSFEFLLNGKGISSPSLNEPNPPSENTNTSEDFFRAVNVIEPSLIRVESDESTYDFHIMLRVDIESMLVDKSLKVADLPVVWNDQIKKYLDLKVPNDSEGVLQDIHWSGGQFGTFCNYTIGNVMAAQLINTMDKKQPNIREDINKANYSSLLNWLRENIH